VVLIENGGHDFAPANELTNRPVGQRSTIITCFRGRSQELSWWILQISFVLVVSETLRQLLQHQYVRCHSGLLIPWCTTSGLQLAIQMRERSSLRQSVPTS